MSESEILAIAGECVAYSIMYGCSLSNAVDDYECYPGGVSTGLDPDTDLAVRTHLGLDTDDGRGDY